MAFLFSPKILPFHDESLEGYFLRILEENFFDSYQDLSLAIKEELHDLDYEVHGAFPIELRLLNIYHAKQNSHFRIRALSLVEVLLGLPPYELQQLALFRSNRTFVGSFVAVHRNGIDIPLNFIRQSKDTEVASIPICPACLMDEPYIRLIWHVKPYDACVKHECDLLHHCPQCHTPINYIENESITYCVCGFDLSKAVVAPAKGEKLTLAKTLMNDDNTAQSQLLNCTSATHRFAALSWYQKRNNGRLTGVIEYFEHWPDNFYCELDLVTARAEFGLVDVFNRTSFNSIYGNLIFDAQSLWPIIDRIFSAGI